MKLSFQKFGLLVIALFISLLGVATPNWSVNSANYSLDFSVIATVNYFGTNSFSTNDMLGAFDAQGNVRGVANVSYNSLAGVYVANMTVLGNTPGDSITFKIYNASDDSIVDAINPAVIFQPNILLGNLLSPYFITNVNVPLDVHLMAPAFSDSVPVNTYVGQLTLSAFDSLNTSPTYAFTDSVGNSDSIHFEIRNDSLFTNALFDYDIDSAFTLKISGTQQGISVFNTFEVRVYKHLFTGNYGLYLNAPTFADSVPVHTFIGEISMDLYDSTIGNPTFAFTDSVINADSSFFYIRNDSLFTNALFNYDSNYIFYVKINGQLRGQQVFNSFEIRVYKSVFVSGHSLLLNAPHFPDTVSLHTFVGLISMTGYDTANYTPTYAFTDSVSNVDSINFYIQNDSLFTNVLFNYDSNYIFFLKINGTVQGHTTYNSFELRVFKPAPTVGYGLFLNAPIFPDTVSVNTYVGKLSMVGYDTNLGTPTYAFTDTTGNADSSYFYIRNDSLFTDSVFNYDSNYIFFLKVHGEVLGQTTYETFQVRVFKANPPVGYALFLDAPIFSEAVPLDTYVGKLRMSGYDTAIGNPLFAYTDTIGNADSAFFYIRNDSLFTQSLFNYDSNYIFFLKIHGEVLGLTTFETFQVRISKHVPGPGFPMTLNAPTFADSVAIGTYVGKLSMSGFDTNLYTPEYAFTDTTGNADSSYFFIQNDSLFTNRLFDYDSNYIFFVKIQGEVLNQTSYETFEIRVFNSRPNGIQENKKMKVSMFPNPATDWVQFHFESESTEEINIFIYSATGQLVKQANSSSSNQTLLNISDLKKGLYLVEISTPLNRDVKQLIITQ